jgi:outer membrane protein TolC
MYVTNVARREVARWDIRVRRADYLPSVGLNIYGGWQPNLPYVKGAGTRLDGGAVVTMSTPIFHFGERREAVRSAQSKLRSAEVAVEDLADEIRLNESNGWTNLLATQERVEAIRRNLAIATENLEISTYSYGEGLATMLDVMQAQLSWLQIYSNAIAAQYDYAVAISAYRYIVAK